MPDKQPERLINLIMDELSGVDHGANLSDGWLVMKNLTPEQREAVLDALEDVEMTHEALFEALEAAMTHMDDAPDQVKQAMQVVRDYLVELFGGSDDSLVTQAADVDKVATRFEDLPLADLDTAWSASAAIKRVREWAGAEDSPNSQYLKAFFWVDTAAPDNFGSYKLPFADVIDGSLKAVPRGVFAAAAVVQGARGGFKGDDIDAIKRHIERYYEKLGRPAPWQTSKWRERVARVLDHVLRREDTLSVDDVRKVLLEVVWSEERSLEGTRRRLNDALAKLFADNDAETSYWVQDLTRDQALVGCFMRGVQTTWVAGYLDSGAVATLADPTTWTKVQLSYTEVPAA